MNLYELPFAKIILLQDDIAEVIIDEGIEMDAPMVEQYHDFLLNHLRAPFSLLINKLNSYTYDFEAQRLLGTLEEINAMAVISYNRTTKTSTEVLAKMVPREQEWNLSIFSDRVQGLSWLVSEQKKITRAAS